ncbi:MAG: hypothetical protein ABW024_06455 [Microbacterium sp.]
MFWSRYGGVIGWLFVVGAGLGAAMMTVLFGWLIPPDRGEESVVFAMPLFGAAVGAVSALAASAGYWIGEGFWIRKAVRTVASRAWVGGLAAGAGVATFWIVYGFAMSGGFGLVVWIPIGVICGLIALIVATPLTARAARRADSDLSNGIPTM